MEEIIEYLNSIFPLSEALKQHLRSVLKARLLRKRQYLLKAGHISRSINFIKKGILYCYFLAGDKKITSWILSEGDIVVSVCSFYNQVPSYEYIQTLEDCEVWYITFDELQFIYRTYLEFNFIRGVKTEMYYVLKNDHAHCLQSMDAQRRVDWFDARFPNLLNRVPNRYIAWFLNMNEVTYSRIFSRR